MDYEEDKSSEYNEKPLRDAHKIMEDINTQVEDLKELLDELKAINL